MKGQFQKAPVDHGSKVSSQYSANKTGKLLIWNSGLPALLAQMALQAGVSLLLTPGILGSVTFKVSE